MQKKYVLVCALLAISFAVQGMDDAHKAARRLKFLKKHIQADAENVYLGDGLDGAGEQEIDLAVAGLAHKSKSDKQRVKEVLVAIIAVQMPGIIEHIILSNRSRL